MGRLLGIDYGTKRLGFAVSDEEHILATPLTVVEVTGAADAVGAAARIASEQEVERIVVGMPYNMDGSVGPAAQAAKAFIDRLASHTGLPVDDFDERLTTSLVERSLIETDTSRKQRRNVRDKLAAQVILQGYLDRGSSEF